MVQRGAVVVTGASSGIGEAIAMRLAHDGYLVIGLSRRGSVPSSDRGRIIGLPCDVSDEHARVTAWDAVRELDVPLAGLVNAAGFQVTSSSADLPLDELRDVLETNLVGSIRLCQLVYPVLRDQGGGLILNVGSFYAKLGVPNFLAYSASKAGLESITRTLAVEWATDGISVVTLAPGYVETGLNAEFLAVPGNRERLARKVPVGRLATSEEIARLAGLLFSAEVRFLTGETIYVDGAQGVRL